MINLVKKIMLKNKVTISPILATGVAILSVLAWSSSNQQAVAAGITAPSGYNVSLFASDPTGASAPDSIAISGNNIFVGYGNRTKSDGTDPTPNTIAEYTTTGQLVKTFSVPGHNDGLRVNPTNGEVYALLNQDGNPQLTVINPTTNVQSTYGLPSEPGRGYDDLQFLNSQAFVSITNPVDSTSAILGQLTFDLAGDTFVVTPILTAGATVVDGAGNPVTLDPATLDPDSLGISPSGDLLLDDQDGEALISVSSPGTTSQKVVLLPHSGTSVDDTVFAPTGPSTLLVADTSGATEGVYQISGPFTPGTAYTSATGKNFVGTLDPSSGTITALVSGLTSPHGLGFIDVSGAGPNVNSVPEPDSVLGMLMIGLLGASFQWKRLCK